VQRTRTAGFSRSNEIVHEESRGHRGPSRQGQHSAARCGEGNSINLAGLEDSLWGEWTGLDGTATPHMLSQGDIGRLLRPFGIRSKTVWPPGRRQDTKSDAGYYRWQFEAAWASYCEPSATPPQASEVRYLSRP
jgi:hypothetical protein